MRRTMLWGVFVVAACNGGGGDDTAGDDSADTADTADSGDTTGDTGAEEVTFRNHDENCALIGAIQPAAGENGQWGAVRLTPPSYPFLLTHVSLSLMHQPDDATTRCTSDQAYTLKLFVLPTTPYNLPPNPNAGVPPTPTEEWAFPEGAALGERVLEHDLTTPYLMQQGDHVYLAVNTRYFSADVRTCIKTCRDGLLIDPPRNYWSNASSPASWNWTVLTPTAGPGIWAEASGYPQ